MLSDPPSLPARRTGRRGSTGGTVSYTHLFDEYRRELGPIGHDPAELLAFVSVFGELSEEELNSTLQAVFDIQYQLTGQEVTETREMVDDDGKVTTIQVRVFETTLTVLPFSEAAADQLTPEQLKQFQQNIKKEASA